MSTQVHGGRRSGGGRRCEHRNGGENTERSLAHGRDTSNQHRLASPGLPGDPLRDQTRGSHQSVEIIFHTMATRFQILQDTNSNQSILFEWRGDEAGCKGWFICSALEGNICGDYGVRASHSKSTAPVDVCYEAQPVEVLLRQGKAGRFFSNCPLAQFI